VSAQKDEKMNYNSARYDNLHQRLQMLIMDMQDELNDYSVRLEELKAMVVLAEAQRGTLEGAVYDEAQLDELRQMIDRVALASSQRANAVASRPCSAPPAPSAPDDPPSTKMADKKSKKKALLGNILFYGALVIFVLAVLFTSLKSGTGVKTFLGRSAFIVKTSSMESVYPKGSFIMTKSVDPNTLQVGDDITFMSSQTSTITHRIISIYEQYGDTNARGFETQGVMNDEPDKNIVLASNVVGKVVFCSAFIGTIIAFVSKNWPILLFSIAVIVGLSIVLRRIFKEEDGEEKPKQKKKKKDKDFFDDLDDIDDLEDFDDDDFDDFAEDLMD